METTQGCFICQRVVACQNGTNPHFVCEVPSGYVVLCDQQTYRGYTILLSRYCKTELSQLTNEQRLQFLDDMSKVAGVVEKVFCPKKMNYELLGNGDPHLHWHLIPRIQEDQNPGQPIWVIPKEQRSAVLSDEERENLKQALREEVLKCYS